MNVLGKFRIKNLTNKLLAVFSAVALVASSFLVSAVWATADTASPAGTHYNVVMDADDVPYKEWKDSGVGSVSIVATNSYSGNAYAWNRGSNGSSSSIVDVTFNTTGYSDETAVVFYVDASAQIADKANYTFMINTLTDAGESCFRLDSGKTLYTIAAGATAAAEITSGNQTIPVEKGYVGWYVIPFSSFTKHWGPDSAITSGCVSLLRLTTGTNLNSVLYIDDFGFAADVEAFTAAAVAGTLSANRGDEGGAEVPVEDYTYNVVMDFDTLTGSFSNIGDYTGTNTSVAVAEGNGYEGKALHANRGTNGSGNAGGYSFEIDYTPTGDTTDNAFVFYLDSTLSTGITKGTVLNQPIRIYDKGGENGATRCFKIPQGALYYFVSADGEIFEKAGTGSNSQVGVEIGTAGWYVIPFSSFEEQWPNAGSGTVDAGGVFRWATGNGANWGNYYCFDNVGFAADAAAFASAAAADTLVAKLVSSGEGEEGGEEGGSGEGSESGGETGDSSTATSIIAQDFEGTVEMPAGTEGMYEIVDSDNGKALKLLRGTTAITIDSVSYNAVGTADHTALAFWYDATNTGFADGISFSLIPRTGVGAGGITLGGGYPVTTVIDGVVAKDDTSIVTGSFTIKPKAGTKGWIIIEIPKEGYESKRWSYEGEPGYTGTMENMAAVGLGIPYFNNSSIILDEFTLVADVDAFIEAGCKGEQPEAGGDEGGESGGDEGDDSGESDKATSIIAQDFEGTVEMPAGTEGMYEIVDSDNGKALKLLRGTTAITIKSVPFNAVGTADHTALAFWYDATNTGFADGISFSLIPRVEATSGGTTLATGYPVTTVIDGVVTKDDSSIISGNFTVKPKAGTKGWIIIEIPKEGASDKMWAFDGGAYNGTMLNMGYVQLGVPSFDNSSIILDEFTLVADVDAFIEAGCKGEQPEAGGDEGGESGGDEGGESGGDEGETGDDDGVDTTVIAQDFEGTVEMPEDAAGKYEIVDSDNGKALKIFRETTPITIKSVPFNEIGTADHQYLAFWYDATGCADKFYFGMIPRDADGNGITIASGHPVTTVVNGVVTKDDTKITSQNFCFKPATGTKGWMIVEINDQGEGDRIWKFDGGDTYTGTMENLAAVELRLPEFHNSSVILDQFTLVDDLDAFIESIGGSAEEDDPYVPDLSNPSPSDYNLAVDFDEKMPTEIKHEGGGFAEVSGNISFSGNALWWDRGTDTAFNNTTATVTFAPTGYSDENAIVFWYDASNISSSHNFTFLIYDNGGADGAEQCLKPKADAIYRTISDDGEIVDKFVPANGSIKAEKGFSGWVVIPFTSLTNHWTSAAITVKPGTVHKIMVQHGNTYGNQIYIDNIGFTHNMDNFAEKAVAGTLNEGGRVDVGDNVLPLPDGAGTSDTVLTGGADGKTADNEWFHTAVNFNSKAPLNLTTPQNAYVKLVQEGLSGYGSALNWFKNTNSEASNITFVMENGKAEDVGIALWINTKDSGNAFATKIRFMPHDKKDGVERCWRLINGAQIYLVQDGVIEQTFIDTAQNLTVPGGFEGWVIVPYEAFEHHWGVVEGDDKSTYTIDPATVYVLDLYYGNQSVTKAIQIDEIGYFTNAEEFAKTMGEFPVKPIYDQPFQSMDATVGEGGVADAAGEGVLAWTDSANTVLGLTGDYCNDGFALSVDTKGNAQIHVAIDNGEEYGIVDPSTTAKFTGLAFWVYTESAGAELQISLKLSDGRVIKVDPQDLSTDFYRLVDENIFDTTAHTYADGTISLPAEFQGWVVIDTCAFADGDWNMSMVTEMIVDVANETVLYLDTFRTGTNAASLLYNTMHFPMDDDLILSADAAKVVIEEQEDGTRVINLYQDGLTSGQFRKLAVTRAGYRVIYRDAQNRQVFGSVSDMADIVTIEVLLGSVKQVEYTLAIDGVIPEGPGGSGSSPDTGDSTVLWVYVLAAAMLGIAGTLFAVNRKATQK